MKKIDKPTDNNQNTQLDDDDNPELSEEFFKKAKTGKRQLEKFFGKKNADELITGVKPIGRPKKEWPKVKTTLRLDHDVIEEFRLYGKGWQTKLNSALHEWLDNRRQ